MENIREKFIQTMEFMEPNAQMDEDQGKVLLNLTMMIQANPDLDELTLDDEVEGEMLEEVRDTLKKMPAVKIFNDRLKICSPDTKVSLGALGALSVFVGSPGEAVLTAYYVHLKYGGDVVKSHDICLNLFRMGFFTEEQLHKLWDMQKRHGEKPDNWLDYREFWEDVK